ncbi:glucosidase 2 subunit beta isoform X2 [Nymphaea colorata]|uniref:glucosidase 2 subunit beta isoform X2 n=1 Tax=Nymphaea colorata TaxID=210225 RepID=UPI00129D7D99|nr:glucosidase 2 subunit beta isoform X2 [Nymphaea colorata]
MTYWIFLLGFIWLAVTYNGVEADSAVQLLGLSPLDEKYFKSEAIKCKDGSKSFVRARLNDGFCDCADGTDEPGTPACPEGRFFCRNSGHTPLTLFSSRVNDGICDCCDGSDEYDGKIKCPNTCWEAGKAAREKLKKKISTFQEGSAIRRQEIEHAKQAIEKEEAELSKLKKEEKLLKDVVDKLKENKQQIEKAEEEERLKKEKEAEKLKETGKKVEQVNELEETPPATPDEAHAVEDADFGNEFEQDGSDVSNQASGLNEVKEETFENTESMSKEELGRVVASRWTGQHSDDHTEELHHTGDIEDDDDSGTPENRSDDEYDGYHSDSGGHDRTYGDDMEPDSLEEDDVEEHVDHDISSNSDLDDATKISDLSVIGASSWLDKFRQSFQAVLQSLKLFKTPVNTSDASRVRKEYDDYSGKLLKMQSRISSLSEKLKTDFGPEKEFYSFYDSCFEKKQDKYVYKVCPFQQASQVEGHSTTRLGHWEKFEEGYRVMQFSNGERCWNGPDRSLKVRLRCGLKNELVDVDEPSRCEYESVMSSPAVCLEERLKELQDKLDSMNEGRMEGHDEL